MVEIPDSLHCLFSATVEKRDGTYVINVPAEEVTNGTITPGEAYRIGLFEQPSSSTTATEHRAAQRQPAQATTPPPEPGPPVEAGEVREVTIESLGDQGDGIAKVEHGYVVIVPDTTPGDEVTVEIDEVRENVAFATVTTNEQHPL